MLVLHGSNDPKVHPASASTAYDLLKQRGHSVKMLTFNGVNHAWHGGERDCDDDSDENGC